LVCWDCRTPDPLPELRQVRQAVGARLVGGVSLGAHAAARLAAREPAAVDGLLVVLPAWLGAPDQVAGLTAAAAAEIGRTGLAATTARVRRDATGWVGEELAAAWSTYPAPSLVRLLRAAAESRAPDRDDLAAVPVPTGVVALAGDPYHPVDVARRWTAALPRAALQVLPTDAPAADRAVLGAAGLVAYRRAAAGVNASR
jgi:pimeloyl-ACP methyl ester carboxylesterase